MSFFLNTAYDGFNITAGGGAFVKPAGAIYVGGGGDVTLVTVGNTTLTFTNIPAGAIIPVKTKNVTAATATNLIGLTEIG